MTIDDRTQSTKMIGCSNDDQGRVHRTRLCRRDADRIRVDEQNRDRSPTLSVLGEPTTRHDRDAPPA
jgi:hypothetical protein